jgi:phosphosulfolactate phosphohydrolase-like enzyme
VKDARPTVVIDAFPDSPFRRRGSDAIACIDVMLATTTLVSAAAEGRRAFVAAVGPDIGTLVERFPDAIVAGELEGSATGQFVAPDGPCALSRMATDARPLVLASPPGTALIVNAAEGAGTVFLACFRNLSATAAALAGYERVALLAAGCREEWSCEDQMAAAWIAERLLDLGFTAEDRITADMVRRWTGIEPALAGWGNSAAELRRRGRNEEVDFVIAHVDDVDRACVCEGREALFARGSVGAAASGGGRPRNGRAEE